jgi:Family of unknown function (DUF6348)
MSDSVRLLELIEKYIVAHGGDLGGWTRQSDDALQLFDGRVTLRADAREAGTTAAGAAHVHAHVLTTLHEHADEVLDACLTGIGKDSTAALGQAAANWMILVAGPIRSFIDNKPVCMTCQAAVQGGEASEGYSQGDYGLSPGLRAFVGPCFFRGFDHEQVPWSTDDTKPWFRFAAESAAPRRVHLAKATVSWDAKEGWYRQLEIDGHDVSHHDPDWPAAAPGCNFGYLTRFAVFEFPPNSVEISRRAELERTIRYYAENFKKYESVDRLVEEMVSAGFDPDLVQETECISTIAFGRVFFAERGVKYPPTVIRARRDGRVETDVPLMGIPAYSRARALAAQFGDKMPEDDFMALCLHNAESQVILKSLEGAGEKPDFSEITLYPCVVPERGVSDETMDAALATLQSLAQQDNSKPRKPWWKFW